MACLNTVFGKEAFVTWSFKIPFLLSLVLVGTGVYIRLKIRETPQFTKVIKSNETSSAPLLEVVRRFPKEIILAALLHISEQMAFYVVTAIVLSYMASGSRDHDYTYNFVLVGTLIAAGIELILVPLFGHLSFTIGRKKISAWDPVTLGVWGFVYLAMLDSGVT